MAREVDTSDRAALRWELRCGFFRTFERLDATAIPALKKVYNQPKGVPLSEFKNALREWAASRHIDEPWVMETLQHTLMWWGRDYGMGFFVNLPRYFTPSVALTWRAMLSEELSEWFKDVQGFDPDAETQAECEARLDKRFAEFKDAHIARHLEMAKEAGRVRYVDKKRQE